MAPLTDGRGLGMPRRAVGRCVGEGVYSRPRRRYQASSSSSMSPSIRSATSSSPSSSSSGRCRRPRRCRPRSRRRPRGMSLPDSSASASSRPRARGRRPPRPCPRPPPRLAAASAARRARRHGHGGRHTVCPHLGQMIGVFAQIVELRAAARALTRFVPSSGFATGSNLVRKTKEERLRLVAQIPGCQRVLSLAPPWRRANLRDDARRLIRADAPPCVLPRRRPTSLGREPLSAVPPAPMTALRSRSRPAAPARSGARPRAGRQVDLAPRPDLRPADGRRDRRSRACSKATTCCAPPQACRALGATVTRDGRRAPGGSRASASAACASPRGVLDFGNAGTGARLMMGVVGGHGDHRDLRRRRLAAQAADAARPRSARADGRAGLARPRAAAAAHPARRRRSGADRLPHAGRLGADQVGRAARRPQRARRAPR